MAVSGASRFVWVARKSNAPVRDVPSVHLPFKRHVVDTGVRKVERLAQRWRVRGHGHDPTTRGHDLFSLLRRTSMEGHDACMN